MSRSPAAESSPKGDNAWLAVNNSDSDGEERKESKAAASSSAVPLSASSSAAAAPSAASVASSSSHSLRGEVEDLLCSVCLEPFTCEDDAARLPRLLPCGRHQMCSSCIVDSIKVNPGSVRCPKGHGLLPISSAGVAAAALSTAEDWMRLLPPFADFITAIKNQQLLMTRLAQKGAECSHEGCNAPVTHFCSDCGDLCGTHERKRHALVSFKSHKGATMTIGDKAALVQQQKQSKIASPAAKIRLQVSEGLSWKQHQLRVAEDELRQLRAQTQQKEQEVEATAKAVGVMQQMADQMLAANDSAVLEMEADRLEAGGQPHRPRIDSTVLNTLPDDRIADLQTFLGAGRLLSTAKLVYRASRDGFAAKDWWRMCGGKFNLLTIVKVKRNGFVFGAFTAFQWPADSENEEHIADPTGHTFLFSLSNAHNRALKLRLQANAGAGRVYGSGYGPTFGAVHDDVLLMHQGESAHEATGNYCSSGSFEFDSVADGGAPIVYDKTVLAGDDGKHNSFVYFAATEIETWQL